MGVQDQPEASEQPDNRGGLVGVQRKQRWTQGDRYSKKFFACFLFILRGMKIAAQQQSVAPELLSSLTAMSHVKEPSSTGREKR